MPALYVISFARTNQINSPIIGAWTSDLISYFEVWKEECAGSVQRHAEGTYGQRGFSRTGMNGLLLTISTQLVPEVTGHSNMSRVYQELYDSKNYHQADFPPWLSGQNALVLSTPALAMLTQLWKALWPPGYLFLPSTIPSTYCVPPWLLLQLPPPIPMTWGTSQSPFLAHSSSPQGFVFCAPFEQYLCSSFDTKLFFYCLRREHHCPSLFTTEETIGISKSGNNVKPFEVLRSVQKALKTLHDINPRKYFDLSTIISITTTACEMNKPILFLFW